MSFLEKLKTRCEKYKKWFVCTRFLLNQSYCSDIIIILVNNVFQSKSISIHSTKVSILYWWIIKKNIFNTLLWLINSNNHNVILFFQLITFGHTNYKLNRIIDFQISRFPFIKYWVNPLVQLNSFLNKIIHQMVKAR